MSYEQLSGKSPYWFLDDVTWQIKHGCLQKRSWEICEGDSATPLSAFAPIVESNHNLRKRLKNGGGILFQGFDITGNISGARSGLGMVHSSNHATLCAEVGVKEPFWEYSLPLLRIFLLSNNPASSLLTYEQV